MNRYDRNQTILRAAGELFEILLLVILYSLIWKYYRAQIGKGLFLFRGKIVLLGLYALIADLIFRASDGFSYESLKLTDLVVSQSIAVVLLNVITYFQLCLLANGMLSPVPMLLLTLAEIVLLTLFLLLLKRIYQRTIPDRRMLLVYGTEKARGIAEKFEKKSEKYRVLEEISADQELPVLIERIGKYDTVILNDIGVQKRNEILKYCYENGICTYIVPRITDVLVKGAEELTLFDTPIARLSGYGPQFAERILKRAFDLLICIVLLLPSLAVMGVIAVFIKLEDGGSVFYRQKRLTRNNRVFEMIKFRSMIEKAEKETGAVLAEENDPRITAVGKILRRYRLDELPQIFNVLKGDLSIVGPRPERPEIAEQIIREMPEFAYRTKVQGGITGYAQVYGKYNTEPYDKLKMDLMYIQNYSLLLDLRILLMTPQILFRKESTEGVKRS